MWCPNPFAVNHINRPRRQQRRRPATLSSCSTVQDEVQKNTKQKHKHTIITAILEEEERWNRIDSNRMDGWMNGWIRTNKRKVYACSIQVQGRSHRRNKLFVISWLMQAGMQADILQALFTHNKTNASYTSEMSLMRYGMTTDESVLSPTLCLDLLFALTYL